MPYSPVKESAGLYGRKGDGEMIDETEVEDMNASELLREVAEENQTRKILDILKESTDLEEAIEKVKALLEK